MSKGECPFCRIVAGHDRSAREVYRDEQVVAFLPTDPATLGHTLVVPRLHVADIWAVSEALAGHVAAVTVRLAAVIEGALHPDGLNVIQSNGRAATQTVFHLHVHLVPRWEVDSMGRIWPEQTNFSDEQKDQVWEKLKAAARPIAP